MHKPPKRPQGNGNSLKDQEEQAFSEEAYPKALSRPRRAYYWLGGDSTSRG